VAFLKGLLQDKDSYYDSEVEKFKRKVEIHMKN
jgi:hypothetical protein